MVLCIVLLGSQSLCNRVAESCLLDNAFLGDDWFCQQYWYDSNEKHWRGCRAHTDVLFLLLPAVNPGVGGVVRVQLALQHVVLVDLL